MIKHLLCFTFVVLVSCREEEPVVAIPPRPVITQTVADPRGDEARTFSGIVKAADSANLGFEVPGRITSVIAKAGRSYLQGDVLAQLDVANLESDLRRAKAEALQMNEELKRVQQLFESENTSRAKLDSAIAAQRAATASVEVAQKKVSDGTLRMPYDGVIESIILDEQSVVSAGTAVMSIQSSGAMKVRVGIPAELIGQVKLGMAAKVHVGRLTQGGIAAKVDRIYPQASKNGTYQVSLVLTETPPEVLGGMDAEAEMIFPNPNGRTLRIDNAAVAGSPTGKHFVWVVSEGTQVTVKKRPVEVGKLRGDGQIEILSGLQPNEKIVIRGVYQITEDMVVKLSQLP